MILNFATYIWINDPVDLIQIAVIKTQYTEPFAEINFFMNFTEKSR